mgnify:CR=1 FL=1
MNAPMPLQNQLLATKFFLPIASGTLISRPRLTALLAESLKQPLTLVSAPAGFGKTMLLSAWAQSLPPSNIQVAWVSLDEEDNEPRLFWTYVLSALDQQQPDRFTSLLMQLRSPQPPPFKYVLVALINLLVESTEHFVLILDDYHLITEQEVHTTLLYLVEHLPPQLHIILATRADPPLPLPLLQTRQQLLEVRTDELRCTAEETRAFFHEVMHIHLLDEMIQEVTTRTEGWLVGLQLLALSLQGHADPTTLLEEVSGDQRYILDYLTEDVLRRQPPEVQTFLLYTSILEQLNASLCDAVMELHESQQMLQRLEQANLFVVSLDNKRQWYRYHALFAQALRYQLEQTQGDLVPILHHRASLWYAQHDQTTQAILHAFSAKEWEWAADLIERLPVMSLTWGAGEHELALLRQWLEQLPVDIVGSRPSLCLACSQILWAIAPPTTLDAWSNGAQATLSASLTRLKTHGDTPSSEALQQQENMLGEAIAWHAFLQSHREDGQTALALCQQAKGLLSAENALGYAFVGTAQLIAYYSSSANDAVTAIQSGLQAANGLAAVPGMTSLAIADMGYTIMYMIGAGQLYKAQQLIQRAVQLGTPSGERMLPDVGWPILLQAEIQREWNELDTAQSLVEEAISLSKQTVSIASLMYSLLGLSVLLRICLSRRALDAARSALQEFERVSMRMSQPMALHYRSLFTTIDQVRFWLASGEWDRAMYWAQELDTVEGHGTSFAREREEVARARICLAMAQPAIALQRLEPVLQRATTGQRWGHVIEIRLLQALAHQMRQEEALALDVLSEAVRLAEPEGYIRSFVDEGASMAMLLYRLRKRDRKSRPTPYLDTVLAAFQQEIMGQIQAGEQTKTQALPDPLSERELQVLQLLAQGASNQEIAQELVIVIDTVKRHVSHIFSKLGVQNRVQAVRQARELGLLGEEG